MKQYIDKSVVVAEIKRRIILLENNSDGIISMLASGMFVNEYKDLLSFLEHLEEKEVDLEKEYKEFVEEDPVYSKLVNGIVGKAIAKHFFELGLKAKEI